MASTNIEDQDLLKQEIINTMKKNSIDIRWNKLVIQFNKIEQQLSNLVISLQ